MSALTVISELIGYILSAVIIMTIIILGFIAYLWVMKDE